MHFAPRDDVDLSATLPLRATVHDPEIEAPLIEEAGPPRLQFLQVGEEVSSHSLSRLDFGRQQSVAGIEEQVDLEAFAIPEEEARPARPRWILAFRTSVTTQFSNNAPRKGWVRN